MRAAWTTVAMALAAGAAVASAAAPDAALEVALGVAGPLAAAVGSLALMERAYRRGPEQLAKLMVRAFVAKLVLFGLYVTLAVGLLALDAAWFIGSFAVSFVALHLTEAAHLQRSFTR